MKGPLKLEPLFPDRATGEGVAVQLVRRLREAVESGAIAPGTRMLASRELAKQLGLARNTVMFAFEQLTAEGYLETRRGAGTFVVSTVPRRSKVRHHVAVEIPTQARHVEALRKHFEIAAGFGPLRPGMPDLAEFPARAWSACVREAIRKQPADMGYSPAYGLLSLRTAIANHVAQFRGVRAQADDIIVVEGAQAAMHLIALTLARENNVVAIEDPCYALARAAFEAGRLRLVPVLVDDEGISADHLPKKARLAYVTPTHQFPLGGTLPLARRMSLLSWADEKDAYVVEDDYDSEFTTRVRPLPALQSLGRHERVIYVGSFSKSLAPALRLGYIVVPPHLVRAFRAMRASTSLGAALSLQQAVATFIDRRQFARHIRRMNGIYNTRRRILAETLTELTKSGFQLGPCHTGLHIALRASKKSFDDVALSRTFPGQILVPLSRLCLTRKDCRGWVLGFSNGSDAAITEAASALVSALRRR